MGDERIELGIEAVRRLNPHPARFARYVPKRRQYVQVGRAPTDEEIEAHIRGACLLGGVSADDDGKTNCVGLDLDAHTSDQRPLAAAKRFATTCNALEIPLVIHTSKSGKGCHIRALFQQPVTCWLARALFVALAITAGIDQDKAMDKVWPPSKGYGVLALPYQAKYAAHTGGTLALNPHSFEVVPKGEQIEAVTEAMEISPEDIEGLLNFLGVKSEQAAKLLSGHALHAMGTTIKDGSDGGIQHMIQHCKAVRKLQEDASNLSYDFWFGMMTNFKPFWGGKELFEAFSQLDVKRWEQKAFDRSWNGITGKPRYCNNLGTDWSCPDRDTCTARSPAALPFALRRQGKAG